ncbi:hypothetical protein ATK17_3134 [Branchiibius hedensis]|uniref:Uncharacterized protein n=1 Tax=Branchiibius hedensis TaxID=672460 RepID=A0A2Y9BUI3_9MICO|nr:hypothetical protein [Branchiibius hedensis]PWJ26951.1 hypothetical protein ATK17_3134 [Branchiibius hedensis]SSA35762.1 hypothetical protein SAMN04489750_3134 [Branchiibius hedensis]
MTDVATRDTVPLTATATQLTADLPMTVRDLRSRQFDSVSLHLNPDIIRLLQGDHPDLGPSVLTLTTRAPYADNGLLDFYAPGRWDCTAGLVFMGSIHQVGASVGEWEGSVGYASYTIADPGTYLVALAFRGSAQTMRMSGPFGEVSMASNSNAQTSWLTATISTSTPGEKVWTNFSAREDHGWAGLAYFEEFSVHRLS